MRKIHCLNPISKLGTGLLTENYEMTDNLAEAEGILVKDFKGIEQKDRTKTVFFCLKWKERL